jgi:preprotein translocase subunit SecY
MIDSIKNIFSIPDLRKRVLYTFGLLAVYRVGGHIATPGVKWRALEAWFSSTQGGGLLGFVDLFAGGNFRRFTIFALGIMPYVSASIILQLLTVISPTLERLSKEGEVGRRKITQWTRYGTVALSIIQSGAIAMWLQSVSVGAGGEGVVSPSLRGVPFLLLTVLTLTTGTAFIMWLGEQISDRGIGNGISLIIFAGIIVGFPNAVIKTLQQIADNTISPLVVAALIVLMVAVVGGIVFVERAQRKIPIQYARRVVGRKIYGGQSTYLPLRVNSGGVIPVIFASSILAIPQTLLSAGATRWGSTALQIVAQQLGYSMPIYNLLYFIGIIFFCFFYTSIIFNPVDTADNMKKYGGFIPGIRPGRRTAEYIDRILTRITFGGAIYLGLISILPVFLISGLHLHQLWPPALANFFDNLPGFINTGFGITFYFGGTSLLIVVGVAMDTVQQIESQLIMRNYDGFLKGTRIRGRRG